MKAQTYDTIPEVRNTMGEEDLPIIAGTSMPLARDNTNVWKLATAFGLVSTLMVGTVLAWTRAGSARSVLSDIPPPTTSLRLDPTTSTSAAVDACSFDECYASNCNAAVAPFECLFNNGGPHGGCSPVVWMEGTCDVQCDLSNCGDLEIPDTTESCEGVQCDSEWCKSGQICTVDVPFQCTDGSARFGCSTEKFTWTLKTDGSTCSSCCDVNTC